MSTPKTLVAGAGKLANEVRVGLGASAGHWTDRHALPPSAISKVTAVVHAGSGRELPEIVGFCRERGAVLIELSTGTDVAALAQGMPVVICPNANILMIKFMAMLARNGHWFRDCQIAITESHQANKTSVPGTAVAMAEALGVAPQAIVSVRDPAVQTSQLGLAPKDLARHAFHRIQIDDGACAITLETRVQGNTPYVDGVRRIIGAALSHPLENRPYDVLEFIDNGWL
ncbi:dihydrodipicolinate reductase C-terminal domain-containing protein [Hydrogenophaga sp. A37]|uniref:dihydrodipicolinate reductase C-terminal domain-containing protein n=1 Tax=Hydrogenophaga sp. A37 TaxID=1945864 RepID=UPI0009842677|nr:dihydrodipicolinate reductase C-terminal domain-containing protein [Hydrogenophaga sp. A37]OOG83819.1 dihydrodipicolinate reductase [Hydrogenophaga sp. A37]